MLILLQLSTFIKTHAKTLLLAGAVLAVWGLLFFVAQYGARKQAHKTEVEAVQRATEILKKNEIIRERVHNATDEKLCANIGGTIIDGLCQSQSR